MHALYSNIVSYIFFLMYVHHTHAPVAMEQTIWVRVRMCLWAVLGHARKRNWKMFKNRISPLCYRCMHAYTAGSSYTIVVLTCSNGLPCASGFNWIV